MKKILISIVTMALLIALAIPMAIPVAAHVEGAPFTVDLIADGGSEATEIVVGEVNVWNDETNLYVQYVVDPPWVLTGSHLYVGKTNPALFPSTPGQFPYSPDMNKAPEGTTASYDEGSMTYTIPLTEIYEYEFVGKGKGKGLNAIETPGVEPCNNIYIAAHSGVERVELETFTAQPELTWQRSAETEGAIAHFPGYGGQWDPLTDGFTILLDEFQDVWDNGTYHTPPGTPSGNFASWNYKGTVGTEGPNYDGTYGSDLRRFQAEFTAPSECTVTGGTLSAVSFDGIPINDNVYVFVNEDLIFWGGTRVYTGEMSSTFQGVTGAAAARGTTSPAETDRWYIPGTLPALTNLTSGTNAIDVFTEENERWGGLGELVLSLDCERTITYTETAWGDGTNFGTNWAMYFEYHIQETNPAILVVTQALSGSNDESEKTTVEGYLTALGYTDVDYLPEPGGGLTSGDLAGYDVVIYLSWSYPAAYTNIGTAQTLIDYFDGGGGLIVVGDDISRVGSQSSPGHPYQPQHPTLGNDWEDITRLDYVNNGGTYGLGITDGYLITIGSGPHPVIAGIEDETFTYYIDPDTNTFQSEAGADALATATRNSSTPYSDLNGGTAITAYDDGVGKIVVIGLAFYNGQYVPSGPNTVPAIPSSIAQTLLGNAIFWVSN